MPTQSHCSRTQRRRGQESRVTIDVYDTALSFVILGVAPERVHHRPDAASLTPAAPGLPSFLLCPDFETAAGCMCGADCKYFHVDTTDLVRREIHVNRAWRSLDAVAYARTAARVKLSVYAPNHRQPIEQLDSATLLLTVGCEAALTYTPPVDAPCDEPVDLAAPSHCAHFYFNRMCNRGRTCRYIHAVHVDAAASDGDLAPQPPVILGLRGRRRMESLTRECTNDVDCHACSIDAEPFDEDPVNDVCGETESAPNSGNLDDDAVFAEMLRQAESRCAPASSSPVKEFVTVYRHDPYRRW